MVLFKSLLAGWRFTSSSDVVDIYDIANDEWSTYNMASERITHSALSTNNQAFIFAGFDTTVNGVPTAIDVFTDETVLSTPSTPFIPDLRVYPNPTSHFLFFDAKNRKNSTFKIIDNLGKEHNEFFIANGSIDISHLIKGLYFLVEASEKTGEVISKSRFVKY